MAANQPTTTRTGEVLPDDEGGLRAPPGLTGWRKAWWWFDFIILVKLARLRFIAVLVVIGVVITQWDTLLAYYDRWTRPKSSATAGAAPDVEYFCPMHPTIVRSEPGQKCPICFMPLSKRKKGSGRDEPLPAGVVNRVQLSPYRVVLAGANTWPIDYVPLTKEITAVGFIEFNERGQRTVAARTAGRIDKLVANETGQMVHSGDALASLYSPDLFATVQNLRQAHQSGNKENLESLKTRLRLQGIDESQIEEILQAPQADPHLTIRSPISGHIITKYVREGQYVEEGAPLYDLADLSTVWIQAQIYEDDLAFLPADVDHDSVAAARAIDVTALTRAFPNEEFHGKLAFIYPHVDQETRTVTVRIELPNPDHKLRPGSTATVKLLVSPRDMPLFTGREGDEKFREMLEEGMLLAIPENAVIDTGGQRLAYRERTPGVYEGVAVDLGPRMAGPVGAAFYPVLAGLKSGDRVVASGSFLIDAETRLNPAAGSIYFGGGGSSEDRSSNVTTVRPSTPEDVEATIQAGLAALSPEDRKLAEAQRICPVLGTRLGAMGAPLKVVIEGRPVFLCCIGCKDKALADPQGTLRNLDHPKGAGEMNEAEPNNGEMPPPSASASDVDADEEAAIELAFAQLSPEDRKLAEAQKYCVVLDGNRLGAMGPPTKLLIDGQPVFVCCENCKEKALANPQKALERARHLAAGHVLHGPEASP